MAKFSDAKKILGPVARTIGFEAAWYLPAPARMAVEVAESVAVQQSAAHQSLAATAAVQAAAAPAPVAEVAVPASGKAPDYFFDGNGAWIAYREGDHLFDAATNAWLGWSPNHNDDFAGPDGTYLCSAWHAWLTRADAAPWEGSFGRTAPLSAAIPQAPTAAVPPPTPPPAGTARFQRRLT